MRGLIKFFSFVILFILIWAGNALAGQKVFFYHTDPAGTPLVMTDEKRNVVWRAEYKPFGEEFEVTPEPENNKMFVGKEMDKETGLYYFGARYMEPMIGRFISTDPIGAVDAKTGETNQIIIHDPQRINSYAYGLNNPHKYIDPDGETPLIGLAIAAKVLGPLIVSGVQAAVITLGGVLAAKTAVEVYNASRSESQGESDPAKTKISSKVSNETASAERERSVKKGIPEKELGPSGKPKIHNVEHPTRKEAKDAARNEGKGQPIEHGGSDKSHFHPTDAKGKKIPSVHHNFP